MDRTQELEKKVAELQAIIAIMDKSAMMLVRRDIELRHANAKLSELDKNKSEFVSIAAHQMRTPLSAIKWSQQMLFNEELGPLNGDQKKIITQTMDSVNGLVVLVNNLLTADHLELGKGNNVVKRINIILLINDVIKTLFPIASEKGVTVNFNYPEGEVPLDTNPERMKDVFANLLDNAIKYTPQGGVITITLRVTNTIVVTVTDTGIGIPDDYVPKLFGRFVRADNAKRADPNGSGLGLYIVKKIIQANNGTITVSSVAGSGTTFTVTLPLAVN
jgi:signal transduction histidine kinase